jgi:hypothetical protein
LSHLKSLRSRFAEFHAEIDVCPLLQFHVHAEIANVTAHVVTKNSCCATHTVHTATPLGVLSGDVPAPKHSALIHVLPSVGGLWN